MAAQTKDPLGVTGLVLGGKYVVERAMGEGGTAVVYAGTNTAVGERVAIKFLFLLAQADPVDHPVILEEFMREGRLVAELSTRSSAIVQARDMGVLERPGQAPLPYLVLEWLEGKTLDELLVSETNSGKPPRSLGDAVQLIEPIAGALALAHERGIAHRDVKPENIFVLDRPQGQAGARIKLLDFGIAKVMKKRVAGVQQTGTLPTAFTPHYGAPEQFSRTFGETGTWSDVFAMALVILEVMRGGRRAFKGDDYVELAKQSSDEGYRPTPHALGLQVNEDVESVFQRALAVQPTLRYALMGDFWAALLGAANPRASGFPLTGPSAAAAAVRRASTPPPQPTVAVASTPAKRGGSRMIIIVAAIGGVILIAAAGIVAGRKLAASNDAPSAAASTAAPSTSSSAPAPPVTSVASGAVPPPMLCPKGSVIVPGSRFEMGSPTRKEDGPEHRVFVDTFCLDTNEVSAKAFAECVGLGSCTAPSTQGATEAARCTYGNAETADHPVSCVTFDEASTMCAFRGMRLPTEAEWELAAQRGVDHKAPWPEQGPIGERANLDGDDPFPHTAPVTSLDKGASKDGIFHLVGNVAEWMGDYYAPYTGVEALNPKGPSSGSKRAVRGGSWSGYTLQKDGGLAKGAFEITRRESLAPDARSAAVGFRCAADLKK